MSAARSPPRWPPPARRRCSMHPAEASHGDLGMVTPGDVVLAISNSGESDELAAVMPAIKRLGVTLIAMTGRAESTLAQHADIVISARSTRSLPAQPRAHRQHHGSDGARRCARGGTARRTRLPRGRLRAFAPRRLARPQAADPCARRDAQRRAVPRVAPDTGLVEMMREMTRGPGRHRGGRGRWPHRRHLHRRRSAPPDRRGADLRTLNARGASRQTEDRARRCARGRGCRPDGAAPHHQRAGGG